jgi:uncharacterized damage-inducible protein DinB
MNPAIEAIIIELTAEAAATRRLLDRVPADQLDWRPHPRSQSLGELALHTATIPGAIVKLLASDGIDMSSVRFGGGQVRPARELPEVLDESVAAARTWLSGLEDGAANATWRAHRAGKELFSAPRLSLLRSLMLSHWYHHRGQLTVYLRQLDIPLPAIYGPTADENPFAA